MRGTRAAGVLHANEGTSRPNLVLPAVGRHGTLIANRPVPWHQPSPEALSSARPKRNRPAGAACFYPAWPWGRSFMPLASGSRW